MDDRQINDFEQHEEVHTVIYNAAGEEIDRKEGRVTVRPKDYADQLPITCKQVKVTTELVNVYRIEK